MQNLTPIIYSIIIIITLLSQIQPANASPLPKTNIPALEGESNYKHWASLVRNSLIVLGIWYTITNPEPAKEYDTIVVKKGTETTRKETRKGNQTNAEEIRKWINDDAKATAYMALFAGPTTTHHIDEYNSTVHSNWNKLKKDFGSCGAMATFHALRAFQQFKFDTNQPFAKQMEQLQLVQVELSDLGHKISDNKIALAMLMGLPESWSNVISAFIASQPDLF